MLGDSHEELVEVGLVQLLVIRQLAELLDVLELHKVLLAELVMLSQAPRRIIAAAPSFQQRHRVVAQFALSIHSSAENSLYVRRDCTAFRKLAGLVRGVLDFPLHLRKNLRHVSCLLLRDLPGGGDLLLLLAPNLLHSFEGVKAEESHTRDRALCFGNLSFGQGSLELVVIAGIEHTLEDGLRVCDLRAFAEVLVEELLVLFEARVIEVQVDLPAVVLAVEYIDITKEKSRNRPSQKIMAYY